jgi:hypothetical protein
MVTHLRRARKWGEGGRSGEGGAQLTPALPPGGRRKQTSDERSAPRRGWCPAPLLPTAPRLKSEVCVAEAEDGAHREPRRQRAAGQRGAARRAAHRAPRAAPASPGGRLGAREDGEQRGPGAPLVQRMGALAAVRARCVFGGTAGRAWSAARRDRARSNPPQPDAAPHPPPGRELQTLSLASISAWWDGIQRQWTICEMGA